MLAGDVMNQKMNNAGSSTISAAVLNFFDFKAGFTAPRAVFRLLGRRDFLVSGTSLNKR